MQKLRSSIRFKLVAAFAVATAIALLVATGFLAVTAWHAQRVQARSELEAIAELIGANSTAALVFNDEGAAREILSSLEAVPDVVLAVLYDADEREFARYTGQAHDHSVTAFGVIEHRNRPWFHQDVTVIHRIELQGSIIGTVVLQATLMTRLQQLKNDAMASLLVIFASFVVAVAVGWRLQRGITGPIRQLAQLLQEVTQEHDYSKRAPVSGDDELGMLARDINAMLARIQERDLSLEQHRRELEDEVSRRTAALKETNARLQEELAERERAETRLAEALAELERHHQDFEVLTQMNERLQVCHAIEETRPVVAHFGGTLFRNGTGALYLFNQSRTLVESLAQWGAGPAPVDIFSQSECWALRQGRPHVVDDPAAGLNCQHCADQVSGPYVCMPMIAYGDVLGLLHLRLPQSESRVSDGFLQLAASAAEQLGLALANLRLREALQNQSVRDPLTGLYNRRFMKESLDRELSRTHRAGGSLAVVMLDVDRFKAFNDVYGHEAGDAVLRALGHFLQENIRTGDIPCRYGGEEFLVILPDTSVEAAVNRAEELRRGIRNLQVQAGRRQLEQISASFGVAMAPQHGELADELVAAAAGALYRAKQQGRDRVVLAALPNEAGGQLQGVETEQKPAAI
jgi:diguanylate cyclase (GGDEF)-like protein